MVGLEFDSQEADGMLRNHSQVASPLSRAVDDLNDSGAFLLIAS